MTKPLRCVNTERPLTNQQQECFMAKADLTAARLRELLDYDASTGVFFWRRSVGSRAQKGQAAGTTNGRGYIKICIDGSQYLAHRLAWLHVSGNWPTHNIDHISGNRTDNCICNLRDVAQSLNLQNQRFARTDNKNSGLLGVRKLRQRWGASITVDKKRIHLGLFDTAQQAHEKYLDAKRNLHPANTL